MGVCSPSECGLCACKRGCTRAGVLGDAALRGDDAAFGDDADAALRGDDAAFGDDADATLRGDADALRCTESLDLWLSDDWPPLCIFKYFLEFLYFLYNIFRVLILYFTS